MADKIATFDDWTDLFYKWQKDIGFDSAVRLTVLKGSF
jgi:hypothetical protein